MAILQRVNLIPQERIDIPYLTQDPTDDIICNFLSALCNLRIISEWEYYTSGVLKTQPIKVLPYISEAHQDELDRTFIQRHM